MGIATSPPSLDTSLPAAFREEEQFYSRYDWCLNPILALEELFQRLHEELQRAPALAAPWQRVETRINVYLFVCAIACTVDDYLSRQLTDLTPIAAHFPRLRGAVNLATRLVDAVQAVRSVSADRSIARWRREWEACVDGACDLLVDEPDPGDRRWTELESRIRALSAFRFPGPLLRRRMLLPAAFRNQDLAHHDIAALARRVAASRANSAEPLVIIGPRTAGAYFAPLLKAHLAAAGASVLSWIAIRPKQGLSFWEHRRLRQLRRNGAHLVLVDEPPNSGETVRLAVAILARAGISADRITLAVPRSPARADWSWPAEPAGAPSPRLITLDPQEYHKARLLEPAAIAPLLREYCGPNARPLQNAKVEALNADLRAHHRDGFHVRIKRVFQLGGGGPGGHATGTHVIAKSVGWGWLGYHAYIAGTRLSGLVPRVIGVRQGLLFTEWVGDPKTEVRNRIPDPVRTLASYVATRARRLRLAEDPCFQNLAYARTGWSELVNILRRVYGHRVGRLKMPALHRRLRQFVSPMPAFIDGRVEPGEWVGNGTGSFKADFEHHNFGKTELNVVDPAYDLACATLAFGFSPDQERQLLEAYASESGDSTVGERILLYKLLRGTVAMVTAFLKAAADPSDARFEWNRRYLTARAFLTSQLSRFAASRIPMPAAATWSKRLFFLDLDGVFHCEALGFPHTTASGVAALDLLRAHGFSVILNTGRSVADVHSYCRDYSLPGGLAELGCVFVDAVAGREISLIDAEATAQLARCRQALSRAPGVFVDPLYRYAVRAYRYGDEQTVPLPAALVEDLLREAGLDRLAVSASPVDVIVLPRGIDKGSGLTAVREYLGCGGRPVVAMGDSDRDVPMLAAADVAFAPAGCSAAVRALAAQGACRILPLPMQRGLLRAVKELASQLTAPADRPAFEPVRRPSRQDLMDALLHVAERSRLRQLLGGLAWWSL